MPVSIKNKAGKAVTTVKHKTGAEEVSEETLTLPGLLEAKLIAQVGVEASMTKNLGNYESVRLQCSLVMPCPTDEINETFEFAQNWVNSKMEDLIDGLEAADKD